MKPPVLIVCFRRPRNLELILKECHDKSRDIFIFIDKSYFDDELNNEVIRVAHLYMLTTERIKVKVSDTNLGVRYAVPSAINWALENSDSLIVLEDDCIPNEFTLEYFDGCFRFINEEVVLISGSTLPYFPKKLEGYLYESEFPLIWGWALTKASWERIRPDREVRLKDVVKAIIKRPKNLISILYFYAAVIRINCNSLNAWDSPVALRMLVENYKSILPDCSVISNVGLDLVASHFQPKLPKTESVVTTYGVRAPALVKNVNKKQSSELSNNIKTQVYNMKFQHVFSPIKSLLICGIEKLNYSN
jgi:hypothetical protein